MSFACRFSTFNCATIIRYLLITYSYYSTTAIPFEDFIGYPFGSDTDQTLPTCDDCAVELEFSPPFPLFDESFTHTSVSDKSFTNIRTYNIGDKERIYS